MRELERMLKALANGRRLLMLKYLKRKERASVGDIADEVKLLFKSTSRHLAVLTGAGHVEKEQESLIMWHSIAERRHKIFSEVLKHL